MRKDYWEFSRGDWWGRLVFTVDAQGKTVVDLNPQMVRCLQTDSGRSVLGDALQTKRLKRSTGTHLANGEISMMMVKTVSKARIWTRMTGIFCKQK